MEIVKKDPANFNPNVVIPARTESFRFWCQKVLPLVYDDSLSYYELLCKVVDYLNNTMSDVNTLGTNVNNINKAYIQLQSYVNDYFSTLDVQKEINNKLDVMAQDGTLSALIQPLFDTYKTTIDNAVNQQNNKINVLENRMNTFTSLPSGSTSGDAELIDIRVPAKGFNNDHPYANAGDAVRGQTKSLKEDLENYINSNTVKRYFDFEMGGYDFNTGEKIDNLDTEIRSVQKVLIPRTTIYVNSGFKAYFIKMEGTQITERIPWSTGFIHIDGGNYLIRLAKTNSEKMSVDLYTNIYYTEVASHFEDYSKTLSDSYIYDLFEYDLFERGQYAVSDGTIINDNLDSFLKRYRCKDFLNEKIQFIKCDDNLLIYLIRYNLDGTYIQTFSPSNERVLLENGTTYKYKFFVYKSDDSQMVDKDLEKIHLYSKNIECPHFYRKTVNFVGDSITQGVNTIRTFHDMLNDYISFKKVNNYGANGTTISVYKNSPAPDAAMCRRITSIDNSADINFIFGGTNDFYRNVPIGDLYDINGDGNRTINYSESTFVGAYNIICKYLSDNFASKQNILLTPIHRSTFSNQYTDLQRNEEGLYLEDYVNAVKSVAKLWSFQYIDLYSDSGLNPSNPKNAKLYFHDGSDGKPIDLLHPNTLGHERIARTIFAKLKVIWLFN